MIFIIFRREIVIKVRQFYEKLGKSTYFKSILHLTTGSFIAQIITILVSPITTRLYTAEELGIYTLMVTIISIFGPILSGKYDVTIVSADSEKEANELVIGSIIFSAFSILIITVGYQFYLKQNPEIVKEVGFFSNLLIIIICITVVNNILNSYNNRKKEYRLISSVYVLRTTAKNVGLIIFGIIGTGSVGLLFSELTGMLFGLKKQSQSLRKNLWQFKEVNLSGVLKTLKKYINQPKYSMPSHFVNSASYSMLNFFIKGLFGMKVLGYYSMSYRILGIPLSLISVNVSRVFFQQASEERNKTGQYNKSLIQTTLFLLFISIPMVLSLVFFAPVLFKIVFGHDWYQAGIYARIMSPMFGIRFIVSALTSSLIISQKQRLELVLQSLFIISSFTIYFFIKQFGFNMIFFLKLISITYFIIYIVFYVFIYKLSKVKIPITK